MFSIVFLWAWSCCCCCCGGIWTQHGVHACIHYPALKWAFVDSLFMNNFHFIQEYRKHIGTGREQAGWRLRRRAGSETAARFVYNNLVWSHKHHTRLLKSLFSSYAKKLTAHLLAAVKSLLLLYVKDFKTLSVICWLMSLKITLQCGRRSGETSFISPVWLNSSLFWWNTDLCWLILWISCWSAAADGVLAVFLRRHIQIVNCFNASLYIVSINNRWNDHRAFYDPSAHCFGLWEHDVTVRSLLESLMLILQKSADIICHVVISWLNLLAPCLFSLFL